MARQRQKKGRPVSGWLVIDKPLEMGSTQVVSKIKWLFGAQKVGHAGTLDPLATGVLPIALGEATKTVPYVMEGTKVYRFTAQWGARTTTDDLEGAVMTTSKKRPSRQAVEALLPKFTGVIRQMPPQFSAVKVDGERAYDLARAGETVAIECRDVEIDAITIVDHDDETTTFEVECGKGTYVRSLARDMGNMLGCNGHVSKLRRTVVDPFDEQDMITIAELEAISEKFAGEDEASAQARFAALDALLLGAGEAMDGFPSVELSDAQATRIRLGNPAMLLGRDAPIAEPEACAFYQGNLIAIGEIAKGQFHPKRVLK